MNSKNVETLIYGGITGTLATEVIVLAQRFYQLFNSSRVGLIILQENIPIPYWLLIEIIMLPTASLTFKTIKNICDKNKHINSNKLIKLNKDTVEIIYTEENEYNNITQPIVIDVDIIEDVESNEKIMKISEKAINVIENKKESLWQKYQRIRKRKP